MKFLIFGVTLLAAVAQAQDYTVSGAFNLAWDHAGDTRLEGFTIHFNALDGAELAPSQDVPNPAARDAVVSLADGYYVIHMNSYGTDAVTGTLVSADSMSIEVSVVTVVPLEAPQNPRVVDIPSGGESTVYLDEVPEMIGDDGIPWELGLRFSPDIDGSITAIRHFQPADDGWAHTGRLWAADGTLLATVDFVNGTPNNWVEAALSPPVEVFAGTEYVVMVDANTLWPATPGYLPPSSSQITVVGNVNSRALGSFSAETTDFGAYFRDVVFAWVN